MRPTKHRSPGALRLGPTLLAMAISLAPSLCAWGSPSAPGDGYYPAEEASERAALVTPRLAGLTRDGARLQWPGESPLVLAVGDRHGDWELVAIIPQGAPLVVLERSFPDWGVLAFIGREGPVATIRKAIGSLASLRGEAQFPPEYFDRMLGAQEDLLGQQVLAGGGDPSYAALAPVLPPVRAYTFLGTPTSREKVIVWPDGRLGLGVHKHELKTVLFDPAEILRMPGGGDAATKQGLVGRYLPVVDYGFLDPRTKSGWEEIAFAAGGEQPRTFVCLRPEGGRRTYWRLPGPRPLGDGAEFYRELLGIQRQWEEFFEGGIDVRVPEERVIDAGKAAIVRALISEVGLHPKYGVGDYAADVHDGFPPATIQLNLCLLDWGFRDEAGARLGYYLSRFVRRDGTFDYYGPALSEYGQMLALAARYVRLAGDTDWLAAHLPELRRVAGYLGAALGASRAENPPQSPFYGLLRGSAEADTSSDRRYYFAGNAWCWRGLKDLGQLLGDEGRRKGDAAMEGLGDRWSADAALLQSHVLKALDRSFQREAIPPFLPPVAGAGKPFARMTESEFSSYTNYRYWLEMLSPGLLAPDMAGAIIAYRTRRGGEVAAMTRFEDHLDDWTYANYASGLLGANQVDHYLLGFYGHLACHQTPGTFTAYEQVAIRGGRTRSYVGDYCVPSQVVTPQMLRWMLVWEPWDRQELWLAPAVPRSWFRGGFSARRVPTRWGEVSLEEKPSGKGLTLRVELAAPHPEPTVYIPLRLVSSGTAPSLAVDGTDHWEWDAGRQAVKLWGQWNRVTIIVGDLPQVR